MYYPLMKHSNERSFSRTSTLTEDNISVSTFGVRGTIARLLEMAGYWRRHGAPWAKEKSRKYTGIARNLREKKGESLP